jgi:hypothetical protein
MRDDRGGHLVSSALLATLLQCLVDTVSCFVVCFSCAVDSDIAYHYL